MCLCGSGLIGRVGLRSLLLRESVRRRKGPRLFIRQDHDAKAIARVERVVNEGEAEVQSSRLGHLDRRQVERDVTRRGDEDPVRTDRHGVEDESAILDREALVHPPIRETDEGD